MRLGFKPKVGAAATATLTLLAACGGGGGDGDDPSARQERVQEVKTLSNRADMISGGDALAEVVLQPDQSGANVKVTLNGKDVTSAFSVRADGRYKAALTGLTNGENQLVAQYKEGPATTLTITNYPAGGPIFSGPQLSPWACMTEANGLGPAQDAQCTAPTKVEYFYHSTDPTKAAFLPFNPSSPPTDIASTTTDQGNTVPFIVRRERGTLNRYVYDIAVLAAPSAQITPWQPPAAWNKKLYYVYVGGALPQQIQGVTSAALNLRALAKGFAVASSSGNIFGNSTNSVTSAEVTIMVKERVVESLGEIRYTLSEGSSGGSMQQHLIANAYPGLLDGIQPSASYQDSWSTNNEVQDCSLLLRYFATGGNAWADVSQRNAVMDNADATPGTCVAWATSPYSLDRAWMDPASGSTYVVSAGLPGGVGLPTTLQPWQYSAANPTGVRSTLQDYQSNIFGKRPDGFANRPYDNAGVQYGLKALKTGRITPEQFVHMNENVGGRDITWNWTAQRSVADPIAIERVYRSGQVNLGTGMASIPVVDIRGCANTEIHSCFHSWTMRERLKKSNGNADNHVILASVGAAGPGNAAPTEEAFALIDKWVAALKADTSTSTDAAKVSRSRPSEASDACWLNGTRIVDPATCAAGVPVFGDPRTGSGAPITVEVMKCQLAPLDRSSYGVAFTDPQWIRLQALFAGGVCNWSAASEGQTAVVPWLNYASGPGGQPMGEPPKSR